MSEDTKEPKAEVKPEDVASQIMVVRTKDDLIAVQFPIVAGSPDFPDVAETLLLFSAGLNVLSGMVRQQQEKVRAMMEAKGSRIALATTIPSEFLSRAKL